MTIVRGLVAGDDLAQLDAWARTIEAWPAGSHRFGHYAEQTAHGPTICRTENVSACHAGVAALVDGRVRGCASSARGEPMAAFKDKINYKQPGGAGFRPHQDEVAYPDATGVCSVLIALDECTLESGCLWLAPPTDAVLPVDDRGVIRADAADDLDWYPAELAPGDAVCIDGLAPHYSQANRSSAARRVLVASYAPERIGYRRDDYYTARAEAMARATDADGRFRISTLADFDGVEVGTGAPPAVACTHR
jgi:ectoine hydroxylase-related dioxygenase (phytanoyl-CoA dioxygenase family)